MIYLKRPKSSLNFLTILINSPCISLFIKCLKTIDHVETFFPCLNKKMDF
jgi:hypothetical protein